MGKAEARDVQKGFKVILPFFTHKLKKANSQFKEGFNIKQHFKFSTFSKYFEITKGCTKNTKVPKQERVQLADKLVSTKKWYAP